MNPRRNDLGSIARSASADGRANSDTFNFDILDTVKRNVWLISFFTLMGIGLATLFFLTVPKTFRSTAKIFVDEKNAPTISGADGESFFSQVAIEKYIEILKSSTVLAPAVKQGNFEALATFSEAEDVLHDLRDGDSFIAKSADIKSNSGVIEISFDGPDPEECRQILDGIIGSFGHHIESTAKDIGGETASLIQQVQQDMLDRLTEVEKQIQALMANPELLTMDGRIINTFQIQQSKLHDELHELRRQRTKLQVNVENVKQSQMAGKNLDALMIGILQDFNEGSLGAYVSTHNQYVELKVLEQRLLNEFGSQHPDLIAIRNQIATVDKLRMQELSTLRGSEPAKAGSDDSQRQMVEIFTDHMAGQINMLNSQEASVKRAIQEEQAEASAAAADVEQLLALQRERDRLEKGYYTVIDRLGEINVLKDFSWRKMSVLNPPSFGEQVAPSLPICVAGGLFLGSLFGLVLAGLKEVAEKTFRSSEDIAAVLGTRVIGHVSLFQRCRPSKDSPYPSVAPELIVLHQPSGNSSESYRSIRTSVFFQAQEKNAKVIQVTSPLPGDGKSTTIANLAASIAQSGRKVLVIDADFRKPTQHKLFGLSNDRGTTSVMYRELDLSEAMRVVQPGFLSVLPCGPMPSNPAELLTCGRFEEVLGACRSQFDFILVDTPPLLAVTDPSIVCRFVDMVYLVMRIRKGVRDCARQAKEGMDSMGVELDGVIINGLKRSDHNRYEYSGNYGYSYGGKAYGKNYSAGSRSIMPHVPAVSNGVESVEEPVLSGSGRVSSSRSRTR